MSTFIFVSPLVFTMMISLWFGWRQRFILFGAWLSICVALAIVIMRAAFGDNALSKTGLTLLGALIMFEISGFGLGLLACRTRNARTQE